MKGPRADLSRLDPTFRGFLDIAPDELGERQAATREIRVKDFKFPQLDSLRIDIVNEETLSLGIARRSTGSLTLGVTNLTFDPPTLADGIDAEYRPSILQVSGPHDQIVTLKSDPSLFQLATVGRRELELGLAGKLFLRVQQGMFTNDSLHRLGFPERDDNLIQVTLTKREETLQLTLDDVEVTPLVPRAAQREGIRQEKPLSFDPATVSVEVTVPKAAFGSRDEARMQLLRDLNVFVDLGDMPFTTLAGRLPVRVEGLPPGSTAKVVPERIDVHWNEAAPPEEPE